MLEYDNSAFYYFALTLLTLYLIPGTWHAVSEIFKAFFGSGEVGAKARTALEKDKADKIKKESTGFNRLRKTSFLLNLFFLVAAGSLFAYLITLVQDNGQVSQFDPYSILGIEQGTGVAEIKRAYRKLSLKFHPDKNIGDKLAEEMFMKIAKAYEALTDETSKENYEKYGNPDGKQALEVSIGLPKILLDNPKVVLVLYLIAMVVVIPVVVGLWYANSKQYGENNIMYESYAAFYQLITEGHRIKHMPEVMAASAECRKINTPKPSDNAPMKELFDKMKSEKLMLKPKYEHAMILRGNLLIHAHLLRANKGLTPEIHKDLDIMLAKAPELVEGMIEICHQRKWFEATISAIKFSQLIIQALWTNSHPLLQLPHLTDSDAKAIAEDAEDPEKVLEQFLRTPDAEKKGLSRFSAEQKQDIFNACKIIPHLTIKTQLYVEDPDSDFFDDPEDTPAVAAAPAATATAPKDDTAVVVAADADDAPAPAAAVSNEPKHDQIFEQDLVTLKVTIVHDNVPEGQNLPPVHAPYFPKTAKEGFWFILTDRPSKADPRRGPVEPTIHAIEKVSEQGRVITHELRFMAPPQAGIYNMDLRIFSDSYVGLDKVIELEFQVHPASELPEYVPHPEDVELDNEPTLFEQVMAANMDEDSSDDEDEKPSGKISASAGGDNDSEEEEEED